jgi:hypothetical protein
MVLDIVKTCFQCEQENPDQSFCGGCGASLELRDYVNASIRAQIDTRDRNRLESDAAMRVFERVFNWVKIVLIIIGFVAALGIWKASDWWSSVNAAKKAVTESSNKARDDVQNAVKVATGKINTSASQASQQSQLFSAYAANAEADLSKQSNGLKRDVDNTRQQIASASALQPQMTEMQKELKTATDQMREQQRAISSSEEFVKKVFSSHRIDLYTVGHEPPTKLVTLPPTASNKNSIVAFLLSNSPIRETLQLQYRVFAQPPDSFTTIHNIVIFSWGEPLANLNDQQLSASYFPDKSDTEIIKALRVENGRIFADGEPLPLFNQADPGFKGNKWMSAPNNGVITPKP